MLPDAEKTSEASSDSSQQVLSASTAVPTQQTKSPGGRDFWLSLIVLCFSSVVVAYEVKSLPVLLPTITNQLGGKANVWLQEAADVAALATAGFAGNLAQVTGRRNALRFFFVLNIIGTTLAAAAQNIAMLLVGRAMQGASASALFTIADIVMCDMVPLNKRTGYIGILSFIFTVMGAVGPLIAGALGDSSTAWRYFFIAELPFLVLGSCLAWYALRNHKRPPTDWKTKLRQIDWSGNLLLAGGTVLVSVGLTFGGNEGDWSSAIVLPTLIIGVVAIVAWPFYERYAVKHPTVPFAALTNRTVLAALVAQLGASISGTAAEMFLPLYFQGVLGRDAFHAAIGGLPWHIAAQICCVGSLVYIQLTQRYRYIMLFGFVTNVSGVALMVLINETTPTWRWAILTFYQGIGQGTCWEVLNPALLAAVGAEMAGPIMTFGSVVRNFGFVSGQAMGNALLQSRLRTTLADPIKQALGDEDYLYGLPGVLSRLSDVDNAQARHAMSNALHWVFAACAICCGVGLAAALFVKEYSLEQEQDHNWGIQEQKREDLDHEAFDSDGKKPATE